MTETQRGIERAMAYIQAQLKLPLDEVEIKVLEWRAEAMASILVCVSLGPDIYAWVRVHNDGTMVQVHPNDVPHAA